MRFSNVTFGYVPERPIVRAMSAALAAGRVCALIGPNAAGKSTLLKLAMGQLEPWQGRVRVARAGAGAPTSSESVDVASLPPHQRARLISYMPQQGMVSFAFTVREVVAMAGFALRTPPDVDAVLARLDLADIAGRIFRELSGGQQQRVLLARALAQSEGGGKALLLDEPTSHMDLWHVHATMRQLRAAAAGGRGVLVVVHDVNLAARYADDVWLLDEGRLVAAGAWHEVLRAELLEPVYRVRFHTMQPDDGAAADDPSIPLEPRDPPRSPEAGNPAESPPRCVFFTEPDDKLLEET